MASLVLGAFNMMAGDGSTRVLAEGTSWGAPVPIEQAMNSFLQDGAIVVTQGHDNREVTVKVRFYGNNLTALATLEASLFAELEEPNTLTWTPDSGPASVFVVVTSSLVQDDESFVGDVQNRPWRTYAVRLTCEAFTRSVSEVTTTGVAPAGATTTSLDTCGATTGWTGTLDGASTTVSTVAGPPSYITITQPAASGTHVLALTKTFAATTTVTKYLMIDWLPSPVQGTLTATGDGVSLPRVAEGASPTAGYIRTWFYVAAASLAVTTLTWTSYQKILTRVVPARVIKVDGVQVTNVQPTIGTNRQQILALDLQGSARAQGSLVVESSTAALGDTLVYVYPADDSTVGYTPPLRQFRSAGGTVTSDATMVSGSRENADLGVTLDVPIGLFPRGSYLLMGRLSTGSSVTTTVSVQGSTILNSVSVGSIPLTSTAVSTTSTYTIFAIARLNLPATDLDLQSNSAGALARLSITATGASTCLYDEFWLFNTSIGQLIQVDCGTGAGTVGGSARRLFIESPSVITPRPTVRIGHSADRSDSFYPATMKSWQFPEFKPPRAYVFVVTPNATDAAVSLAYYPRWHTNPAS